MSRHVPLPCFLSTKREITAEELNALYDGTNAQELLKLIDTTLTPQQKAHVELIKRQYKGSNGKRCNYTMCCAHHSFINQFFSAIHRDVPTPDEVAKFFPDNPPIIPENADALIDWCLSQIPASEWIF